MTDYRLEQRVTVIGNFFFKMTSTIQSAVSNSFALDGVDVVGHPPMAWNVPFAFQVYEFSLIRSIHDGESILTIPTKAILLWHRFQMRPCA